MGDFNAALRKYRVVGGDWPEFGQMWNNASVGYSKEANLLAVSLCAMVNLTTK